MAGSNREVNFSVRAIDKATATLRRVNKRIADIAKPVAKVNKAFSIAERRVKKTTSALTQLAKRMRNVGAAATFGITLPMAAAGATSIKTAAKFQHSMTKVKALTQGDMFGSLKRQAREFGATTMHAASDAADAMGFYAIAGFKANEIYKIMPSTLNLATAATENLAATADIMANIVRGYEIPTDGIKDATDMITGAFSSAKMDLATLGESLVKTGIFNKLDVKFSETLALIGTLRDRGVDAASTGTALAGAANRLIKPVREVKNRIKKLLKIDASQLIDNEGKLGSFVGILARLEKAGAKTDDYSAIFGADAGKYIIQLLGQSQSIRQLQKRIESAKGRTDEFAKAFQTGATGAMYAFKSAVEAVQISIGESGLLQWFTDITFTITSYIQKLSEVNPALLRVFTVFAIGVSVIGPTLLLFSGILSMIAGLGIEFMFLTVVVKLFGSTLLTVLGIMALKFAAFLGVIALIGYVGWFFIQNWEKIGEAFSSVVDGMKVMWDDFVLGFKITFNAFVDLLEKIRGKKKFGIQKLVVESQYEDYPSMEHANLLPEPLQRRLDYGMGPIANEPEVDFGTPHFDPGVPTDGGWNLMPDFIEDSISTLGEALSGPIFNLDDHIDLDIDEEKLGRSIELKPKIKIPTSKLIQQPPLKPFRLGDFLKQNRFKDQVRYDGKSESTKYISKETTNNIIKETSEVTNNLTKHISEVSNIKKSISNTDNSMVKKSYSTMTNNTKTSSPVTNSVTRQIANIDNSVSKEVSDTNNIESIASQTTNSLTKSLSSELTNNVSKQLANTTSVENIASHATSNVTKQNHYDATQIENTVSAITNNVTRRMASIDNSVTKQNYSDITDIKNVVSKTTNEITRNASNLTISKENKDLSNVIEFRSYETINNISNLTSNASNSEHQEVTNVTNRLNDQTKGVDRTIEPRKIANIVPILEDLKRPIQISNSEDPTRQVVEELSNKELTSRSFETKFSKTSHSETSESREVKEVHITIDFENLPHGTEIKTENKRNVPLKVNMGWAT